MILHRLATSGWFVVVGLGGAQGEAVFTLVFSIQKQVPSMTSKVFYPTSGIVLKEAAFTNYVYMAV